MSLAERDTMLKKLSDLCLDIDTKITGMHKHIENTDNIHLQSNKKLCEDYLKSSKTENDAIKGIIKYLKISMESTDDLDVKKKIKFQIRKLEFQMGDYKQR